MGVAAADARPDEVFWKKSGPAGGKIAFSLLGNGTRTDFVLGWRRKGAEWRMKCGAARRRHGETCSRGALARTAQRAFPTRCWDGGFHPWFFDMDRAEARLGVYGLKGLKGRER